MRYEIEYTKKANKGLKKIGLKIRRKIIDAIEEISLGKILNKDIKKLVNSDDQFRVRIGEYRIIYEYIHGELIVLVVNVDVRGSVYR